MDSGCRMGLRFGGSDDDDDDDDDDGDGDGDGDDDDDDDEHKYLCSRGGELLWIKLEEPYS